MRLTQCAKIVVLSLCLSASVVTKTQAADAGVSWPEPATTFYLGDLNGANDLWKSAFEEAALRWNDAPTLFTFNTSRTSGSGYCSGAGTNNVQFSATNCGDSWGSSALAITSFWSNAEELIKADINFNDARAWDVYDGRTRALSIDFRRVAAHEMGHAAGLAHPDVSNALMSAGVNNTYLPAFDDVVALSEKYGNSTHILTLETFGIGKITVTPTVPGTGVVSDNTLYDSDYARFLDCDESKCEIPVQHGLRLTITAVADDTSQFLSWDGTTVMADGATILDSIVALAPMTSSRTLAASFTSPDDPGDTTAPDGTLAQTAPASSSGGGVSNLAMIFCMLLILISRFRANSEKIIANKATPIKYALLMDDDLIKLLHYSAKLNPVERSIHVVGNMILPTIRLANMRTSSKSVNQSVMAHEQHTNGDKYVFSKWGEVGIYCG
jgi:hypothetical protein